MTQEITLAQAAKAAAERERAQIVAWLRKFGSHLVKDQSRALSSAAQAIEAGEHWK